MVMPRLPLTAAALLLPAVVAAVHFKPPVVIGFGSQPYVTGYRPLDAHGQLIVGPLGDTDFASIDGGLSWKTAGFSVPHSTAATFPLGNNSFRTFGSAGSGLNISASYTSLSVSDTVIVSYTPSAGFTLAPASGPMTFSGLPHGVTCGTPRAEFGCPFRPSGTGRVRLADGTLVSTIIVYWGGNPSPALAPLATSVVAFRSANNGVDWTFSGVVANASAFPDSQEGPNENDITVVTIDGVETLLCVFRIDAGDGPVSHPYRPYYLSASTDGGVTWSKGVSLGSGVGCARPRLAVYGSTVVLSGGRLGPTNRDVYLWVNDGSTADGYATGWQPHSITYVHNHLESNSSLHFTPAVNDSSARETTSYTSLIVDGATGTGTLTYSRILPGLPDAVFAMPFAL